LTIVQILQSLCDLAITYSLKYFPLVFWITFHWRRRLHYTFLLFR